MRLAGATYQQQLLQKIQNLEQAGDSLAAALHLLLPIHPEGRRFIELWDEAKES